MTEQEQQVAAQAMRWGAKGLCEGCGGGRGYGMVMCLGCVIRASVTAEMLTSLAQVRAALESFEAEP